MSANFELYKIFFYVAEYSNITHAANELCLTQPSVTKAIQNLENQLGCQLFIRTRRGVKLTAEGAVLFQQIQPACKMFFSAEEGISQRRYFERGSVRISCNDLVVKLVLLPVVEKYRELYPNVNLSIVRTPPADVATALASGALDIAIEFNVDMGASVPDMSIVNVSAMRKSEISTQVLGTYIDVPMVGSQLAFLANAELAFQDLFEYPIIIPSMDTIARNYYMDKFKQYRISRGPDIEASGPERRILFTERNMGISFMPEECVRSEINERRLFPLKLKEKLLERNLLMMTNKVKPLSNAARAFSYMLI